MIEKLTVTGYGNSRSAALNDARRQAATYYGDVKRKYRLVRSWVETRHETPEPDAPVLTFAIEVEFRHRWTFRDHEDRG